MNKIKTGNARIVNGKTLLVTFDIGKGKVTLYFRCPDGRDCKPLDLHYDLKGLEQAWDRICSAKVANHLEQVVVGFESTGAYGEPLIQYFRHKPAKMVQVNPMNTKRLKTLVGNSPGKTDRKDPKVIADIIELGHALSVVVPEGAAAELRRLSSAREGATKRRTALCNRLQDLVFVLFPEFLEVIKNIKTQSAQWLLLHYSTPEQMLACDRDELSAGLKRVSHGKMGRSRAERLYEAASRSMGLKEGQRGMVLEIQQLISEMEGLNRFVKQMQQEMSRWLNEIPYRDSLVSMKGIGEITAAGLVGEVADFHGFQTGPEILKMAGFNLYEISSGKHQGRRRITKMGRPYLRKLLYFAALNTVRKGGIMHGDYQRYLQRGMPKTKALVVIARKLLRILFALVRDHSYYTGQYSQARELKLAA